MTYAKKRGILWVLTIVDDPNDWWFYACKRCWRKMVQAGVSHRP
jgi:hypothetical protein